MRLQQTAAILLISTLATSAETDDKETRNLSVPKQPLAMDSSMGTDTTDIVIPADTGLVPWWPENLIVAPIPSSEPVFGWGLNMFAGLFLDLDKQHPETPASSIGMIGWITENNDYAFGGIASLNLFDDNVRIEAAGINMDINYKFYGVGSDAGDQGIYLDVNQSMPAYYAKAQYQILPNTYLGLGYMGANVDITYSSTSPYVPPGILPISDTTRMAGLEIPFQYDTRDDQQYPRQGWLVDASGIFYQEDIGSDFNAESYNFAANKYLPVRGNDVLALRASTQATSDDAPVFLMSSIGGREDMRGYAFGRHTDKIAYSLQAEYRWQVHDSWILTGFAGVAEVAPDYGSLFNDLLPAAGVGVRYTVSKAYNVNLALDVAVGKHGTEFYFTLGEAF